MWRSATSSESSLAQPCAGAPRTHSVAAVASLLAVCLGATVASAKVLLSVDEALSLAFPGALVERAAEYLTAEQIGAVETLCGQRPESALVVRYLASRDGQRLGTAYLETHRVRTLPETLLVVVAPDGRVARVEVLSFAEPEEYLPREAWYRLFAGRALDDELAVKRGIRPVTGATLTADATTSAVRRVLALHRVIEDGREP